MTDISRYLDRPEIHECRISATAQIPFHASVLEACRVNYCGKYGTCWTCPPGNGAPDELEQRVKRYPYAATFTFKIPLEDSFDFEGMMEGQQYAMEVLRSIVGELKRDGIMHMALGCGGCTLCASCTYPHEPCRFPDLAISSVESYGIHVAELSKILGLKYANGENTVTYFCMIFFGGVYEKESDDLITKQT